MRALPPGAHVSIPRRGDEDWNVNAGQDAEGVFQSLVGAMRTTSSAASSGTSSGFNPS